MQKAKKRKGKIKMWTVLLIILGIIGVGLAGGIIFTAPGRNEIKNLNITNVDFKNLRDGTYIGEYTGTKDSFRNTTVQVTVASGKVTQIKVLKGALDKDGKPVEMTKGLTIDDLFGRVINSQSLQVDTISGATLTCKTHLKATENALEQAEIK